MKRLFTVCLITAIYMTAPGAESLGVLQGIFRPSIIDIHKDRLFVMDIEQVRVYSLEDLSLLSSFGKEGEGPGEYKIIVSLPLTLRVVDDTVIVESVDKLSYFSLDGDFLREVRKQPLLIQVTRIKDNYVGRRIVQPPDGSLSTTSVTIYDSEFNELKELYRQSFIQQGAFPNLTLNLSKDFLLFRVAEDKIFVEKSDQGFLISVYDDAGHRLREIRRDVEKIPFPTEARERLIRELEMDPQIQRQLKQFGLPWEDFSRGFRYEVPEFYPPIRSMDVDGGRLYIKTFRTKNGRQEMMVMDLEGKLLKTVFIEPTVKEWVMALMMGVRLETIHDDKIYYIAENEYEEWELFTQAIE